MGIASWATQQRGGGCGAPMPAGGGVIATGGGGSGQVGWTRRRHAELQTGRWEDRKAAVGTAVGRENGRRDEIGWILRQHEREAGSGRTGEWRRWRSTDAATRLVHRSAQCACSPWQPGAGAWGRGRCLLLGKVPLSLTLDVHPQAPRCPGSGRRSWPSVGASEGRCKCVQTEGGRKRLAVGTNHSINELSPKCFRTRQLRRAELPDGRGSAMRQCVCQGVGEAA
jgi:hypothetical protein